MFPLTHLPPELLSLMLSSSAHSFLVIKLWRCGDRKLQRSLSKHVTTLDLSPSSLGRTQDAQSTKPRLPELIFTSLPALKCLRLSSSYDFIHVQPGGWKSLPVMNNLESLSLLHYAFEYDDDYSPQLVPLGPVFPNLRSLELPPECTVVAPMLRNPPPHLTYLSGYLPFSYYFPRDCKLSDLPRTLERIGGAMHFPGHSANDQVILDDLSHAPPNLRAIDHVNIYDEVLSISLEPLHHINPQQRLPVAGVPNEHLRLLTRVASATSQPPNDFKLACDFISVFPSQITAIRISSFISGSTLVSDGISDFLSLLPRSLTSLEILSFIKSDWSEMRTLTSNGTTFWPSNLTHLSIPYFKGAEFNLDLLPPNVHYLQVGIGSSAPDIDLDGERFPQTFPKLTRLVLMSLCSGVLNLTSSPLTGLIRDFEILSKTGPHPALGFSFYETLKTDRSCLERLSVSFAGTLHQLMPTIRADLSVLTSLKSLTVPYWTTDLLHSLPPSLTYFIVGRLLCLESEHIVQGTLFSGMPASLTVLEFKSTNQACHPNGSSYSLPVQDIGHLKSLKTLNIYQLGNFPSRMLRELPQGLEHLEMELLGCDESDAPFIPPNLRVCKIASISYPLHWKENYLAENWPPRATAQIPRELNSFIQRVQERFLSLCND